MNPNQLSVTPRIGLLARADLVTGNGYGVVIDYAAFNGSPLGDVSIMRFDSFGVTTLASSTALQSGFSLTDRFVLELGVTGSTITGRVFDQPGGTLLLSLSAIDNNYSSGKSGAVVAAFPSRTLFGELDNLSSVAVPEPSTMVLLCTGSLVLIGCGRRRQRSEAA